MEQRTCALCAQPFAPPATGGVKLYCSRQCCRKVANATQRGTVPRPPVGPFDCAMCSKRCVPGANVAANASKFCSRRCKRQWHSPNPEAYNTRIVKPKPDPATRLRWIECRTCGAATVVNPRIGRPLGGWRRQAGWTCPDCPSGWSDNQVNLWTAGQCQECGASFLARNAKSPKFCSNRCAQRAAKATRRAVKRDAFVANVYRADIYERDGYRCQLCNKPVKRDAVVPHPKAPVLDHVIPLAKGGTHEPANVQLAHFMCNSIKSDNIGGAGDQLRLIG